MTAEFYAFGEILWDCLPSGRHAGGAPFNVTAHLVQLGASASLLSAIGDDDLGDEILQVAMDKGVNTEFIARHPKLPTGTVRATVDANGNATYDIVEPVAWDEIEVSAEALEAVAKSRAFIFGSLSCRSPTNVRQLRALLDLRGPMKFFDVNLRPPYADPECILQLAARADVMKLNHEEVGKLAAWIETGDMKSEPPLDAEAVGRAAAVLARATDTPRICVTRAENGAALWDNGTLVTALRPERRRQGYSRCRGFLHGRPHDRTDPRRRSAEASRERLPCRRLRRVAPRGHAASAERDRPPVCVDDVDARVLNWRRLSATDVIRWRFKANQK